MNQKQKSLLIIKAILLSSKDTVKNVPEFISHLEQKIDTCLELANPEVLLSLKEKMVYEQLKEKARKLGKII